jgi:hypothetical protein
LNSQPNLRSVTGTGALICASDRPSRRV